MKYAVTFCATDEKVESNPMWHSCILLSKMNEATHQLEVVDTWGFYGLPSTDKNDSLRRTIKIKMGLDVDLYGNHGMLIHEDLRFLDRGEGLHGVTFELTQQQFELLDRNCKTMAENQYLAIQAIADFLKIPAKSADKTRIYPYEDYSVAIYNTEKLLAKNEGRESRLKPFEFNFTHFSASRTCKSQIIELLATVLSAEQIKRIKGYLPTVPRSSGVMEDIYLHSVGPLHTHIKKSGEIVSYRKAADAGVKLIWTIAPQEVETLSQATTDLLAVDPEYCSQIKSVVRKLQCLERAVRDATFDDSHTSDKGKLIEHHKKLMEQIIACYKAFSIITPKPEEDNTLKSGLYSFFVWLANQPRNKHEGILLKKIGDARMLLNSVYMGLVQAAPDLDYPSAADLMNAAEAADEDELDAADSVEPVLDVAGSVLDEGYSEAVVAYFSERDQRKICKIIGRNYTKDEPDEEVEAETVASVTGSVASAAVVNEDEKESTRATVSPM